MLGRYAPSAAQEWKPSQHVEFISPSAAGGGSDNVVRAIEQVMRAHRLLEVPLSVVNKPGAGGDIAWKSLNQQGADGHHISLLTANLLSNHITGRSALNHTDLTCVAQLFSEASGAAVRSDSPIRSGKELLAKLRTDPAGLTIAVGTAFGGSGHVAIALAATAVGGDARKLKAVVYPAFGQALAAMLGGHIDVVMNPHSSLVPHVQSGKVRAIAVSVPQRVGGVLAEVPTFKELGADVHVEAFRAVVGAKAMTAPQVAYWEGVFQRMADTDEWKQNIQKRGWIDKFATAEGCRNGLRFHYEQARLGLSELGLAKN
jgi:putative tricarboxylic transport membrane protein